MKLSDVKAGDTVIRTNGGWHPHDICKVARATKTQVILGDESRYRKNDGRRVGSRYSQVAIWIPKPGEVDAIHAARHRTEVLNRVARVDWRSIGTTTLEAVVALLPAEETT